MKIQQRFRIKFTLSSSPFCYDYYYYYYYSFRSVSTGTPTASVCKFANLGEALSRFDKLVSARPLPRTYLFNHLLTAVAKLNHHSSVVSLVRRMRVSGLPPNSSTLNILIASFCRLHGGVRYGFSVMGQLFKMGCSPNIVILSCLINGLILEGNVDGALNLFDEMNKKGYKPNVVTYNTILKGMCKNGRVRMAVSLLNKMRDLGCQPDVITYNIIIGGLCRIGRMVDALVYFEAIQNSGENRDLITFLVLLEGLLNHCHLADALTFFHQMKDGGLVSDIKIYNVLMHGLCNAGAIEVAKGLFCSILVRKRLSPDVRTYNIMINGLSKGAMFDEACWLFKKMNEVGCSPNGCTYNVLVQGFLCHGENLRAMKLIDEMFARGFAADPSTARMVLELVSSTDAKDVQDWFKRFRGWTSFQP